MSVGLRGYRVWGEALWVTLCLVELETRRLTYRRFGFNRRRRLLQLADMTTRLYTLGWVTDEIPDIKIMTFSALKVLMSLRIQTLKQCLQRA